MVSFNQLLYPSLEPISRKINRVLRVLIQWNQNQNVINFPNINALKISWAFSLGLAMVSHVYVFKTFRNPYSYSLDIYSILCPKHFLYPPTWKLNVGIIIEAYFANEMNGNNSYFNCMHQTVVSEPIAQLLIYCFNVCIIGVSLCDNCPFIATKGATYVTSFVTVHQLWP